MPSSIDRRACRDPSSCRSSRPSSASTSDPEACFANLDRLAARAREVETWLWLDMEGSAYVDRTLEDSTSGLRASHPNTGICLQAYLRRTPADLQRLLPLRPAVRLVEGRVR